MAYNQNDAVRLGQMLEMGDRAADYTAAVARTAASAIAQCEPSANKVTSITSSSTDTQFPSAKAVYSLFNSATPGTAIVDVVELPTENIREDVLYRLLNGTFVYNGAPNSTWTVINVETLPTTGQPVTTDMMHITAYYCISDKEVYGYINETLSAAAGVPVGWYTFDALGPAFGVSYGGIIYDIRDGSAENTYYFLVQYSIYEYKDIWKSLDSIGWQGSAGGAEIFNTVQNVARGFYSHAEGFSTTASGDGSHAEGYNTTASGGGSHAEGFSTTASGDGSHAEGYNTTANHKSQHVFGAYNAEDDSTASSDARGNFVEIVGNGTEYTRSNARTLDWSGNETLAGKLTLGAAPTADMDAATKQYVDGLFNTIVNGNGVSY